ncbi:MAG: nucleotide-binding protein [Nitrososphaerota archaeon]|nr:nucleotide-binding protein [Nitrososphaerota archaeon]MDG6966008.1 nucleotide-binding protein [Nitrososphaerota archaeon]
MSDPAYVLDSTAFYAGIPYQGNGRYYTTYLVLEEVKHHSVGSSLIHTRVQVTEPSQESLGQVKATAAKTGDIRALSQTDLSLLALGLDLKKSEGGVSLVSDDFAIRNVAEVLSIPLAPTSLKGGEWKNTTWKMYCRGCGKTYTNPKLTTCPICGTQLVRKASNS